MKKYIVITAMLVLAGCASKQSSFVENVTADSRFHLRSIKVDVRSRCPAEDRHFSNVELQDLFSADVEKHLCQLRQCVETPLADDIIVDVEVFYQRVMNGEFLYCAGGYNGAKFGYRYTLSKNGKIFYSAADSSLEANRGFLKNIVRVATQLSGTGDKDDEKDDIDHMTLGLAARIANGL